MRMALDGKSLATHGESARNRPVDRSARRRDWIESNRTAIRSYNRRVEAEGSYGDRMRRF